MLKLFFKLYGFLLATIVTAFVLQLFVIDRLLMSAGEIPARERFRGTFFLIERELAPLPQAQWRTRIDELQAGFATPLKLVALNDLIGSPGMPETHATGLRKGDVVSADREEGGFKLMRRVADSEFAAVIEIPGVKNMNLKWNTFSLGSELLLVGLLVWFWARPFWRDLMNLRVAAETVGEGKLDVKVAMRKGSPLYHFALCFNSMTARIAALIASHKQLTNAVSHELRTPLARLRFSHALAHEETSAQGKDRYLALMERDMNELDQLATEMLTYAKLEREGPQIGLQAVRARTWLEPVVADAELAARAEGRDVRVAVDVGSDMLSCEPRYMARAVGNLLRNALRHGRGHVRVSLATVGQRHTICVDDDGPGIPAVERERLFEPFTRLDQSRDRASGGFGLGLAIVRQVLRWHGGDAHIEDSPLGGARFVLSWPAHLATQEAAPAREPAAAMQPSRA